MKKYFLFSLLLLCGLFAFSQDLVSETQSYIPYQDSLFILRTTIITNQGLEGVNDTTYLYSQALDTSALATQLHVGYQNSTNTDVAKLRNARNFRFVLANYVAEKTLLASINYDLDSLNVARYGQVLSGRYRVFKADNTSYFVDVAQHPTQSGLLRATGTNNEGNANVLVYGRWFIRVTLDGVAQYLVWDGNSTERPVFRHPSYFLSVAISAQNNVRLVKTN